jgi:hypothetical protein
MMIKPGWLQLFGTWFGEAVKAEPKTRKIRYVSSA